MGEGGEEKADAHVPLHRARAETEVAYSTPCALCPVPCVLCPVPCALCPVPCALWRVTGGACLGQDRVLNLLASRGDGVKVEREARTSTPLSLPLPGVFEAGALD
jgi:hypothetical protein